MGSQSSYRVVAAFTPFLLVLASTARLSLKSQDHAPGPHHGHAGRGIPDPISGEMDDVRAGLFLRTVLPVGSPSEAMHRIMLPGSVPCGRSIG